jgi:hypothetical protein
MWLRSRRCSPPIIPLPINPYLMVSLTAPTVLVLVGAEGTLGYSGATVSRGSPTFGA